jgi:hypothetical protein
MVFLVLVKLGELQEKGQRKRKRKKKKKKGRKEEEKKRENIPIRGSLPQHTR